MSFNYQVMIKVVGSITTIIGVSMIPSLIVALIYNENDVALAFAKSVIPALIIGAFLLIRIKPNSANLKARDGFLIVSISWILASMIGALPYLFSGVMPSFIDAFFESSSGFTATGATIIDDLSTIPRGILFWRSFSHWLGGMGILILLISILPALGIGGQSIARAEAPGPTLEKMSTRMSDSARILYIMYIGLTVIEIVLLRLGGLDLFDTFIHTFGSMSTSGLSSYSDGISHFDSVYIESVIIFFMTLASLNFVLYHQLLKGRWRDFFEDRELRAFFMILGGAFLLIAANLRISGAYNSIGESIRDSIFQTVSFISTSGYATVDYTLWPTFSQFILLSLMFIGGCSASTSGSIKVIRFVILYKLIVRGMYKRLHPNAVVPIKIGGKTVSAETVSKVTSFTLLYFIVFVLSALILSLDGHDLVTTLSAAVGTLSNTGAGLGLLGPAGSYSIFSEPIRLYLSIVMIAGRLELLTIILLVMPSFWDPDR